MDNFGTCVAMPAAAVYIQMRIGTGSSVVYQQHRLRLLIFYLTRPVALRYEVINPVSTHARIDC